MKKSMLFNILFLLCFSSVCLSQNYEWARRIGSSGDQYTFDMAVDGESNFYIVGILQGANVDFNPGTGTAYLSSSGGADIFIAKYDSGGNYLWAKKIGGGGDDIGPRIEVDESGSVYIGGWFQSANVDFDPGPGTALLSTAGSTDAYFAKYDKDGNYLWARQIGSSLGDGCHDIFVDGNSDVYISGYFYGTNTDFDPGTGVALLSSVGNSGDIFFAKYDSSGNYLMAKSAGGSAYDVGNDISADENGNMYVTGAFRGTDADFDPGMGTAVMISAGGYDMFVAKYDSAGNYLMAHSIGGTGDDIGSGIVVDQTGQCFVSCYFQGTDIDFDPGPGAHMLTSAGGYDVGLAKFDQDGMLLWAHDLGGPGDDYPGGMMLDDLGNLYTTGSFTGTNVDFDPGRDRAPMNSRGNTDIYFAKYSSQGEYRWAACIGGTGPDFGNGIALGKSRQIYISGGFSGTVVDFDPGSGMATLNSGGGVDIFTGRYFTLRGPHLGMTLPDATPGHFPPASLLSDGIWWWHGSPSFSPDGNEMFFVRYVSTKPSGNMEMLYMKMEDGEWTSPRYPSFASDSGDNSPVFLAGGNSLRFTSRRDATIGIYEVNRTDTGWSPPQPVDFDYGSLPGSLGWDISLGSDETMYFEVFIPDSGLEIFKSTPSGGSYSLFEKLPEQINSVYNEATPFADPAGEYLLFMSNRPGGFGYHDLYVSFKDTAGSWMQAQNLGSIFNGSSEDAFPLVSPDGNVVFFNSAKSGDQGYNAYWVDISALMRLSPSNGILDISINSRWNMLSVPYVMNDYQRTAIFPAATTPATTFNPGTGGYTSTDVLSNGVGYWIKFPSAGLVHLEGGKIHSDTIVVQQGWNMIGSISDPVAVADISSDPPAMLLTVYGYESAYLPADTLWPGKGYWAKVQTSGVLLPGFRDSLARSRRVRVEVSNDVPPVPPDELQTSTEIPAFYLEQNYPNPFNPSTVFRYWLPHRSRIRLRVFNALGQSVSTLVEGVQDGGVHAIEWDARSLPSGVYYCRLDADDDAGTHFTTTRKVMVVK